MVKLHRTLSKNILRLIRRTKGRFFAITAIVTLGVAFFVGVSATSLVMDTSVDRYMDDLSLKDITIYSNYGFDEADVEAVRNVEGVRYAEGAYFTDVTASYGNVSAVTRVHSYNENSKINRFVLKEGRMPENEYEALAEAGSDLMPGFPVGTVLEISMPDGTDNELLKAKRITVVGNADTPLYLNETKENSTLSNQYIRTFLYVKEEAFDSDCWLEINVLSEDGEAFDAFSDEYFDYAEEIRIRIEDLSDTQQNVRYGRLKADAEKEYEDGMKEYMDGLEKFNTETADAEKKIADSEKQIQDGFDEIAAAKKTLADSEKLTDQEYRKNKKIIDDAFSQIKDAEAEIASSEKELAAGEKQAEEAASHIDEINAGTALLKDAITLFEDVSAAVQGAESLLDLSEEEIEALKEAAALISETDPETPLSEFLEQYPQLKPAAEALGLSGEDTVGDLVAGMQELLNTDDAEITAEEMREAIEELDRQRNALIEEAEALAADEEAYNARIAEAEAQLKELDAQISALEEAGGLEAYAEQIAALRERISTAEDLLARLKEADPEMTVAEFRELYPETEDLPEMAWIPEDAAIAEAVLLVNDRISADEQTVLKLIENRDTITQMAGDIDLTDPEAVIRVLKEKKEELEKNLSDIYEGKRKIEEGKRQLEDARRQTADAKKQAEDGLKELESRIAAARASISDGWKAVRANERMLRDAQNELEKGKQELAEAKAEGEAELEDARIRLAEAREEIDSLAAPEWTVLDRQSHYATVTYDATIDQMKAIGDIFPLFFILVAMLVCLTTMTRMVDEERGEIGILRALGYTRLQCAGKYLAYAAAATILGSVLGTVLGLLIFPYIIYNTWKMMYVLPKMILFVPWHLVALTVFSFMAAMAAATWYACSADTSEVPSQLMRPKSPKLGKNLLIEKVTFLWKRLSFTWKVTVRNLFRYKKRLVMTVAGVAGCTALLVTGFGIRDSINNMVDIQFYDIYQYEGTVYADVQGEELKQLVSRLENSSDIDSVTQCYSYSAKAYGSQALNETVLVEIFEGQKELEQAYRIRTMKGHKPIELGDDGVIISEKLAENMGLSPGSVFTLEDHLGHLHEVKVAAVCEMYIRHYAFISSSYYETLCAEHPEDATLLLKTNGDDHVKIQNALVNMDGIKAVEFFDTTLDSFNTMVKSLDLIVWTLLISSMSLAFVVLGNLINVNISERQREIATLKVLGFRRPEVKSYIYKENNILTILGAICGMPLGNLLHHYIMRMVEMDYVMFGRTVKPVSFLMSFALTVLFGVMVDHFMSRKLHKIDMVESLKSVE